MSKTYGELLTASSIFMYYVELNFYIILCPMSFLQGRKYVELWAMERAIAIILTYNLDPVAHK